MGVCVNLIVGCMRECLRIWDEGGLSLSTNNLWYLISSCNFFMLIFLRESIGGFGSMLEMVYSLLLLLIKSNWILVILLHLLLWWIIWLSLLSRIVGLHQIWWSFSGSSYNIGSILERIFLNRILSLTQLISLVSFVGTW